MIMRRYKKLGAFWVFLVQIVLIAVPVFNGDIPMRELSPEAAIAGSLRFTDSAKAESAHLGNLESMGVLDFVKATGATGAGVTLAIVDTGVDPLLPGFRDTSGVLRIVSWKDLSGEGWSQITGKYVEDKGLITVEGKKLDVSGLNGKSRLYFVGSLPKALSDRTMKEILFTVFDPIVPGIFEAVAIDTDGDGSFSDEKVLFRYDESRTVATLRIQGDESISVVISDISGTGESVNFGFDLQGHGTSLAAISAGSGPGNYRGVAPGCDIIVVKALGSDGRGSWADVVDAVRLALDKGADVILVGAVPDLAEQDRPWVAVQKEAAARGAIIVLPAGNNGPGIGTLTTPIEPSGSSLIVGGYLSRVSLVSILGVGAETDYWYPFSSCGPDRSGSRGIDVLGPALSAAPAAGYHRNIRFSVVEGTSVSAAYAAGSLVLLRQAKGMDGLWGAQEGATRVIRALREGAVLFKGLSPVEQGFGKIDLSASWDLLRANIGEPKLLLARKWDGIVTGGDLFLNGRVFGAMPVWVDNYSPMARSINLASTVPWLRCQSQVMSLSSVSQRSTWLYGDTDLGPGFYSGELEADDADTPGIDGRLCITQVIPREFGTASKDLSGQRKMTLEMPLRSPSSVARQFFVIPENIEFVTLAVETSSMSNGFALYNPEGSLVLSGRIRGSDPIRVGMPKPGIWQLCVYPDIETIGGTASENRVELRLGGVFVVDKGVLGDAQKFTVYSDVSRSGKIRFARAAGGEEWRYRKSGIISTSSTTVVTFPQVDETIERLVLRLGTVSTGFLKGYLYWFDKNTGKWQEVASAVTDSSGFADLYYKGVQPGRYIAYIEGSGQGPYIYAEIDAFLIDKGSSVPPKKDGGFAQVLREGPNDIEIIPGVISGAPRLIIMETESGIPLVFERAVVDPGSVPWVQILGNGSVRTLRAWAAGTTYPLDIVLTVGGVSYQLDRGRATAQIPLDGIVTYDIPSGGKMVIDTKNER